MEEKMKNKLKALSAILLFTMLFSLLATLTSCKKDGTTDTKDTTGGSNTELVDTSLPELEIKDFGGYKMQILWPETHPDGHWIHNEISVEETGSDVINQAVRNRNMAVESAYNVKITPVVKWCSDNASKNGMIMLVRNEYAAGESSYDALATGIKFISPLALEGALADFNTLDAYNAKHPWWNDTLMQGFSIANKRYFASGDIIYSDDFYPYCVFVNTKVASEHGVTENFYELVENKEWTLERFHNMAANVADETAGNSNEWSTDTMNGAIINTNFAKAVYYTKGSGMITLDRDGYPTWNMDPQHTQEILEKVINTAFVNNACTFSSSSMISGMSHAQAEIQLFNDNKTLFLAEELIVAERLTKSQNMADFKVLPMPLYDADSEYISVLNDSTVIGIPSMQKDKDRSALILSAMSRESVNTLTPAFFETVLTYRYMQNSESKATLQIILESEVAPDVATIQDWGGFMAGFKNLASQGSTNFSSFYQQNISKARKSLDDYITLLEKQ